MAGRFGQRRTRLRLLAAAALLLAAALGSAGWRRARAPRAWAPEEVPVAFWSWRAETPAREDIERAFAETGARTLFLRAGQLDYAAGRVARVRAVGGEFPVGVELHLVYNATPALLAAFEKIEEGELARAAVETFAKDSARARADGGDVSGLQLDLDVPTRLLARYGRVLKAARARLSNEPNLKESKLSVTGLPTWMESGRELGAALEAVDFWAPQFYGAEVPARGDRVVPISSAEAAARGAARARELGKPFYAGLAAYGYALLYTPRGALVELRGDIDPARVAADRNFELVERRAFEPHALADGGRGPALASEWRYVFRAQAESVLDGLVVRAGDKLVLDVPSGEQLRASARGVRLNAGERLLGICLFRLPERGDATTLGARQIAAALQDREAAVSTILKAAVPERLKGEPANHLLVAAENDGPASALIGEDAFTLRLGVPRGSLRGVVSLEGFDTFETLCVSSPRFGRARADDSSEALRPCAPARAEVLRLRARSWGAGAKARVRLSFETEVPAELSAALAVRAEDGRVWERAEKLETRARTKGTWAR